MTRLQCCPVGSGPPREAMIRGRQEAGRFSLQGRALGTEFFSLWTPYSWVPSGWGPHPKTSRALISHTRSAQHSAQAGL